MTLCIIIYLIAEVWIDNKVDDYCVSVANGIGIRVVVHDPRSYPRLLEHAVAIPPGSDAYVSIEKEVTRHLKRPYAQQDCVDAEERTNFRFASGSEGEYSREACLLDCLLARVSRACNCSFLQPSSACTVAHAYFCMEDIVHNYFAQCECLPTCEEVRYEASVSTLALPTPLVIEESIRKRFNHTTSDDIAANLIHLKVFFNRLQQSEMTQVEAYSHNELVSNFGGQLVLFLGASLLTMIELCEWLLLAPLARFVRFKDENKHKRAHTATAPTTQ